MSKIKWFLGEFFVVVAGVLVAFILNSWWMSIKEAEKERSYLVQIYEDLNSTIDLVKHAEEEQRTITHSASQLMSLTYSRTLPPDSVVNFYIWKSMSFAPASQVSATLSTLVSTGDLQLIRNDSLRTALGDLVSGLNAYSTSNDYVSYFWMIPAYERFADQVNLADFRFQSLNEKTYNMMASDSLHGFTNPADLVKPDPIELKTLLETKSFRQSLLKLHVAHMNFWRMHRDFHEKLLKTRELLIREMESVGVEYTPRDTVSISDPNDS